MTYSGNPFVEAPVISDYLKEHMKEDDTLAVLGSEPEIPFYSHRHSATGYIYTYGLMEAQPLAENMQKEMIDEIEKNNPKYILVVDCRCSWLYNLGSCLDLHNWASRYLRNEVRSRGSDRTPRPRAAGPAARDQLSLGQVGTVGDARPQWFRNQKGEPVALEWLGKFDGIQPNPFAAECTVWSAGVNNAVAGFVGPNRPVAAPLAVC